MENAAAFAEFIIQLAWLALAAAVAYAVMYAIGKSLQTWVRRRRVASEKHDWTAAAETLSPNYHRPATLSELTRRADREAKERTERIARNVMANVSRHHERTEFPH